jgi:predicted outer membrane repeat protein
MARLAAIIISAALVCATALAGVVGSGTPGSCTEAALSAQIGAGGTVTFNCGAGPQTIPLMFTLVVGADNPTVVIDGNDAITLDGAGFNNEMVFVAGSAKSLPNVTFRHITFANGNINTGLVAGGTFQNFGDLTLDSVTIRNSQAAFGGAIVQEPCNGCLTPLLTVTRSQFLNNNANSGGAINLQGGNAVVEDSTFTGNTAGGGGAIDVYTNSTFKIDISIARCTFNGNTATSFGGGAIIVELLNAGSGVRIVNDTFTGNTAASTGKGSAISVSAAPVTITNCTIAGNTAGAGGGAVYFGTRATLMNNTLLASNGGGNCAFTSNGAFTGGHNLQFGDATCTAVALADPLLGPLADNGGPTKTMALGTGSPAIDAADSDFAPLTDQRGSFRKDGNFDGIPAPDIGAFEAPGASPPTRRPAVKH